MLETKVEFFKLGELFLKHFILKRSFLAGFPVTTVNFCLNWLFVYFVYWTICYLIVFIFLLLFLVGAAEYLCPVVCCLFQVVNSIYYEGRRKEAFILFWFSDSTRFIFRCSCNISNS